MLFSCHKYVILERSSWKLPSAFSKNCVSIFIYSCIAFVRVNSIFGPMLLFYEGYIILVSHPNTNPAQQSNFSELRYYKAVRCSEGTLKLVVKRSLPTCQPRSQCLSLPIYFLQSFWVQYFASNHMSCNFSELRYYKAVRCSEGTLKLVVKRSLPTCQPRSQCLSLPIYFLQSFWVQYFASNHMSSQTIYPRLLPWHYNDRQYQNNIVHC